jgi:two-component system response regulator PilR (NtrC family)
VLQIELPPLRSRREDVPLLAQTFLEKYSREYRRDVTLIEPETMERLLAFGWPGNVRQLENVIERGVALATGTSLTPTQLPRELREHADSGSTPRPAVTPPVGAFPDAGVDLERLVEEYELRWIAQALDKAGGVKTRAAELLGLSFRQFRYKYAKYAGRLPRS